MPIIKNIGKRDRMVADRILHPGDAKYISQKQAEQFDGIPDFEIVDETPVAKAVPQGDAKVRSQKDEEPLQTQPEVVSAPVRLPKRKGASTAPVSTPAPLPKGYDVSAKGKKSRGKKK